MDQIDALSELKGLQEAGLIKYSLLDKIITIVNNGNITSAEIENTKKEILDLVDQNVISSDVYEAIKSSFEKVETVNYGNDSTPSKSYEDKPLKGKGIGFVFGFFFSLLGLILGLCLGDEDCKNGAITGFLIELVGGIVIGIVVACSAAAAVALI